jgi:hypothetical protein
MRLLFEESDRNEVDRIRVLFESNGIPVHIGNEDTTRTFGALAAAQKYGIWILEHDQYDCAIELLKDESYEVKKPVDVQAYYQAIKEAYPNVYEFMYKKLLIPGLIFGLLFIGTFIFAVEYFGW